MTTPPNPHGATHPGTIVFEDEDRATSEEKRADEVPESVAFARRGDALVPVVRVVKRADRDNVTIRSYDAEGNLVATTVGRVAQ